MAAKAGPRPALGAVPGPGGTSFRVWAPRARAVEVVLEGAGRFPLAPSPGGYHEGLVSGAGAGDRYRYLVDGAGPFPDPASRWQPDGIHGPSMVVDPGAYRWTDVGFPGLSLGGLTVYELHVGTFSEEGTFAGAAARLGRLADLGVGRSS